MCGSFVLYSSGKTIAEAFDLADVPELSPRSNIVPSQPVAVIRTCPNGRELALLKWGLMPPSCRGWASFRGSKRCRITSFRPGRQGMGDALQAQLVELVGELGTAAIPGDSKHSAAWCVRQLPALYAKFHQTSESRYGEEISRLVRAVLQMLADPAGAFPGSEALAASLLVRLQLLHEQFGIPRLDFGLPGSAKPRPPNAG
jgi:hypothetical protein